MVGSIPPSRGSSTVSVTVFSKSVVARPLTTESFACSGSTSNKLLPRKSSGTPEALAMYVTGTVKVSLVSAPLPVL